ncbi:MAG: FAD-dependent oxidoreductase [Hyphomonadaceae bacterium]
MKIAIVGCGVGGMAAAIALARDGHAVSVFERFAQPQPLGAGLLLQPSGLEALQALGLREAVEAKGARVHALRGEKPSGARVLDITYAHWRPGAYGLGVHRASLFDALYRTLGETDAALHAGVEMVSVENPATPMLFDAQGRAYGPFDLAIAADGAASSLRAAIAPYARAPVYPWGAIWTIRPDTEDRWDGVLAQRYASAAVMIGVLPVGAAPGAAGKHVAVFWSLREDRYEAWRAAGAEAWRGEVARHWPEAARLLEGPLDFAALPFARYRDVRAWPWGHGRTLLIGDAAHATSPQLGQGANLALADAVALAAALRGRGGLQVYRSARFAKTAWVQFMSAALTPLFQSRSRLLGWARDLAMPLARRLWPFNRLILATLTGAGAFPWRTPLWRSSAAPPTPPDQRP